MERLFEEARDLFATRFGEPKGIRFIRVPGAITILGDSSGDPGGPVLAAAVNLDLVLGFRGNGTDEVRAYSQYYNQTVSFSLKEFQAGREPGWMNYLQGAASELQRAGTPLRGFDAVIGGSLPSGMGMGSSSALTLATSLCFQDLAGVRIDPGALVSICQRAETEFVGVGADAADPAASLLGQSGAVMTIDPPTLGVEYAPMPPSDARIVVCDTRVRGDPASSEILRRREQCREGVRQMARLIRGREVKSTRDITLRDFRLYGEALQPPIRQRIKHVVTEGIRVQEFAQSLVKRNIVRAGILLDVSHVSLRDDYGVSCRELDLLVEIAWEAKQVFGARMIGPGFGGCTVNLVEGEAVPAFCETVSRAYKAQTGMVPNIYVCQAAKGAEVIPAPEGGL